MKKLILLFPLIWFAGTANAQTTNFYETSQTFMGVGYTYICEVPNEVWLYNADNRFIGIDWAYADGSPIGMDIALGQTKTIEPDNNYPYMRKRAREIVENIFTNEQKKTVGGKTFTVALYLDPATGRVADVRFKFPPRSAFCAIHFSWYRKMEVALKNEIRFNIAPEGKKLNFCFTSWLHTVGKYVPGQGTDQPDPNTPVGPEIPGRQ